MSDFSESINAISGRGLITEVKEDKKGKKSLFIKLPYSKEGEEVRVTPNHETGEYSLHKGNLLGMSKEDRIKLLQAQADAIPEGSKIVNHGKGTIKGVESRLKLEKHGWEVLRNQDHNQGFKAATYDEIKELADKYNLGEVLKNTTGSTIEGGIEDGEYYVKGVTLQRSNSKSSSKIPGNQHPPVVSNVGPNNPSRGKLDAIDFNDRNLHSKIFDQPVTSLDSEARSLNANAARIDADLWNLGIVTQEGGNRRSTNYFITPEAERGVPIGASEALYYLETGSAWHKLQAKEGKYAEYIAAIEKGETVNAQKAITDMMINQLPNNGFIVMQNINYDQRMIKTAADFIAEDGDIAGDLDEIRGKLRFLPTDKQDLSFFHKPPDVMESSNKARKYFDAFLSSGLEGDFSSTVEQYDTMMEQYVRHMLTDENRGTFAVELMDITRATFAKAAEKGLMQKEHTGIGTRVEFLAQALLNETEKHTSVADADQQISIFSRMIKMYIELRSNNISPETHVDLANIRNNQLNAGYQQYASSVARGLQELKENKSVRVRMSHFAGTQHDSNKYVFERISKDEMVRVPYKMPNYQALKYDDATRVAYTTTEVEEYLADSKLRFPTHDPEILKQIDGVVQENIELGLDNSKVIEYEFERIQHGTPLADIPKLEHIPVQRPVVPKVGTLTGESIFKKLSGISKTKYGIAAGVLAFGSVLLEDDVSAEEIKERQAIVQNNTVTRSVKTFKSPRADVYHGTAMQNYNERKKHHQM